MVHIWVYFLLKANVKDGFWHGVDLKRGQLVTGRKALSTELNLSEQQVRTCLEKLTKTGYINQQATNKYTVVTICNYDSWFDYGNVEQPTNNQQNNQQITTDNIDSIDNIEENKTSKSKREKKEKDNNISFADFEVCWKAYNRKGSKKKSLEQWQKLTDEERKRVLPHVKAYVSSRDKQFQKDFERYLRDKVFDEVIIKGNETVYDPEKFEKTNEYRPTTDGFFQYWDDKRQCLMFNGYIDQLNDGYTADTRPDGARVAWQMYEWVWSSRTKEWIKQND
jgi:DNA-binding Lrp family transcriptional regulator